MMKWGIIGAGRIAHRFSQSLLKFNGCELYAVACRTQEKVDAFAKNYHVNVAYADYEAIVKDKNIDAVYIAVPHQYHFTWIMRCLKAKKAVLCEKPACLTVSEMQQVIQCAKENHVLFMEAMKERFQPVYQTILACINHGTIGKITGIDSCYSGLVPEDFFLQSYLSDPSSMGCLSDVGIYGIAWIEQFVKDVPVLKHVYANVKDSVYMYVRAEMEADSIDCVVTSGIDRNLEKQTIIAGTKGSIVITPMHRPLQAIVYTEHKEILEVPYVEDDFHGEIQEFINVYQSGKIESSIMPFAASLRCAKILQTIEAGMHMDEHALQLLKEEEENLSFSSFDADMVQYLGSLLQMQQRYFDRSAMVQIVDEETDQVVFSYIPDGKEKNGIYLAGKRNVMKKTGHSSLYAWVEHEVYGKHEDMLNGFPTYCLSAGAFPIYVDHTLKYSVLVSGMHEGEDHALIRMCLYMMKNMEEQAYPYRMV